MTADQVYPDVFVSNIEHVRERNTDEFDRVISVCQDSVEDHLGDGTDYEQFNLSDGILDSRRGELSYSLFSEAAGAVADAIQRDEVVLVHCHAGVSRSPSVTAAAIGLRDGVSFRDALAGIETQRRIVNPNSYLRGYGEAFVAENTNGRR